MKARFHMAKSTGWWLHLDGTARITYGPEAGLEEWGKEKGEFLTGEALGGRSGWGVLDNEAAKHRAWDDRAQEDEAAAQEQLFRNRFGKGNQAMIQLEGETVGKEAEGKNKKEEGETKKVQWKGRGEIPMNEYLCFL